MLSAKERPRRVIWPSGMPTGRCAPGLRKPNTPASPFSSSVVNSSHPSQDSRETRPLQVTAL